MTTICVFNFLDTCDLLELNLFHAIILHKNKIYKSVIKKGPHPIYLCPPALKVYDVHKMHKFVNRKYYQNIFIHNQNANAYYNYTVKAYYAKVPKMSIESELQGQ